jgi:hypothetical protein
MLDRQPRMAATIVFNSFFDSVAARAGLGGRRVLPSKDGERTGRVWILAIMFMGVLAVAAASIFDGHCLFAPYGLIRGGELAEGRMALRL